jgi:glycosyltransferase involved in cell wall biosynthesis
MELNELSVIVPTRNEAHNILAFLRSLPEAVELIVVDASEDETLELIASLRPAQTRVIRQLEDKASAKPRLARSIAEARQLGAQAATTPWLLFTDADVVFAPEYFDRLSAHPGWDVLYGPKLSADEHARYYRWFAGGQHLSHRLGIPAISGSNLLISRQAFETSGGFDLQLQCNEDTELGWRVQRQGFSIEFAPDLIVYARDHRRLRRGMLRKTLHSVARCSLLRFNLMPARWRASDWGYWSPANPPERKHSPSLIEEMNTWN